MRVRKTAGRLAAALVLGGSIIGSSVVALPATAAAPTNVWADVYYRAGCSSGGYEALSTGNTNYKFWTDLKSARYSKFANGDRYAHGAYMSHIGSVKVQPHAMVWLTYDGNVTRQYYKNDTNQPKCLTTNSSVTYNSIGIVNR